MTPVRSPSTPLSQATYWHRTRRLTVRLFLLWLVLTFAVIFFARELSRLTLFGWPFSFYMVAQGMTLIYVAIVAVYAWRMQRLDKLLKGEASDGQ